MALTLVLVAALVPQALAETGDGTSDTFGADFESSGFGSPTGQPTEPAPAEPTASGEGESGGVAGASQPRDQGGEGSETGGASETPRTGGGDGRTRTGSLAGGGAAAPAGVLGGGTGGGEQSEDEGEDLEGEEGGRSEGLGEQAPTESILDTVRDLLQDPEDLDAVGEAQELLRLLAARQLEGDELTQAQALNRALRDAVRTGQEATPVDPAQRLAPTRPPLTPGERPPEGQAAAAGPGPGASAEQPATPPGSGRPLPARQQGTGPVQTNPMLLYLELMRGRAGLSDLDRAPPETLERLLEITATARAHRQGEPPGAYVAFHDLILERARQSLERSRQAGPGGGETPGERQQFSGVDAGQVATGAPGYEAGRPPADPPGFAGTQAKVPATPGRTATKVDPTSPPFTATAPVTGLPPMEKLGPPAILGGGALVLFFLSRFPHLGLVLRQGMPTLFPTSPPGAT